MLQGAILRSRRGLPVSRAKHFTKSIATITLIVAAITVMFPSNPTTHGLFFDSLWLQFAAGVGVYQTLNYGTGRIAVALVALLTAAAVHQYFQMPHWEIDHTLHESNVVACLFAIVLIGLHRFDKAVARRRSADKLWPRLLHYLSCTRSVGEGIVSCVVPARFYVGACYAARDDFKLPDRVDRAG